MSILINESELKTHGQKEMLEMFKTGHYCNEKFLKLGGTTYQFSIWAVRKANGKIEIYKTSHDPCGRWVKAKCRPWN